MSCDCCINLYTTIDIILFSSGPEQLDIPGSDLKNICVLRTPEDGKDMAELGKGKDVVIIGSSFIGWY